MSDGKVRQPNERQRALQALELYTAGCSYAEIGRRLGYRDHSGPHRAISRLLSRRETFGVDTLRKVHGERLSALLAAVWPAALRADLDAVKTALQVLGDIAKLYGLNAPERVAVGISDTEFATQAAELLAVVGPGPLAELARWSPELRALPIVEGEVAHSEVYDGNITDGWSNLGTPQPLLAETAPQEAPETASPAPAPLADAESPPGRPPEAENEPEDGDAGPQPEPEDGDAEDDTEPDGADAEPAPRLPTGTQRVAAAEVLGRDGLPVRGLARRLDEPPPAAYDPLAGVRW